MLTKARFILSRKVALQKYDEVKALCDIVSYSYKTNPEVGKVLQKGTMCMFSVHTTEDTTGLDPSRIWFFAQAWDEGELDYLFRKGIYRFVVDNESDLDFLLKYVKTHKKHIELLLRMRLKEHTIHTGKHFVYGMYSARINELIPELKKVKEISKLGIHFHRKTQNVSEWSLREELEDTIIPENWKLLDYVNIGGGIPAEYKNFPHSMVASVFSKIKDLKKWLNSMGIQMIIEPGRYIASYPVKLEAHIKSVYENNIIIDCSVFNAAMDTFVANIRLLIEGEEEEGSAYTVKGCTPDSMDIFRYKVFLKDPSVGDKIVFLNAGAYTYSTDFCNLPKLETVVE